MRVEAFRVTSDEPRSVYRFLLAQPPPNNRVAYTLDNVGDIYLSGQMALSAVDADEVDRVLGR